MSQQHRQKSFDLAQKVLVRALNPDSQHEQRAAIRGLIRILRSGAWAPYELILADSTRDNDIKEIARLWKTIEELEERIRQKEARILELAADKQRERLRQLEKNCTAPSRNHGGIAWQARVNAMQISLHHLEKQFGFGDSMRLAVDHWYQGLPSIEKDMGREAARNWLRQHSGWEHGRLFIYKRRLRWRQHG